MIIMVIMTDMSIKTRGGDNLTGKTHFAFGCTTAFLLLKYFNIEFNTSNLDAISLILLSTGVSSLAPDIDQKQSSIGDVVPIVDDIIVKSSKVVTKFKIRFLQGTLSHRGITHCLLLPIVLSFFYYKLNYPLCFIGLIAGYLSHLFADMLNPGGIPILFPITSKRINLLRIVTGSKWESFVWYIVWGVNILLILNLAGVVNFNGGQISIK